MKTNPKQLQQKIRKVNVDFDITKFRFLRDLVLVRAIRPVSGTLIDPAQYEDKPEFGEVIKKGDLATWLKVGDIIRFGKYSTEAIRTKGADYFIVHEEDVSAVL